MIRTRRKLSGIRLRRRHIAALIGVFVLIAVAIVISFLTPAALSGKITTNSQSNATQTTPSAFNNIQIVAKAAYVLDMTNGDVLYQKDAQEALPLASVTKLMTALVVLDHLHAAGNADTIVTIDRNALMDAGDSGDIGLLLGERWNMQDLLEYTLMSSSNVGATALARGAFVGEDASTSEADFIQAMNLKAGELGFNSMSFYSDNGLDLNTTEASAFGSAEDVAHLLATAITTESDVIDVTALKSKKFVSASGITHTAINTDEIIGELPGLIASKTGNTDLAGGNLVVAFDAGLDHPIVISVLGSTENARFTDVVALASATMAYLESLPKATSTNPTY